jgi:hypothetical protein
MKILYDEKIIERHKHRQRLSFSKNAAVYRLVSDYVIENLKDMGFNGENAYDLSAKNGYLINKLAELDCKPKLFFSDAFKDAILPRQATHISEIEMQFNLVIALFCLNLSNNIQEYLMAIKSILKPGDGIFMGTLFGPKNLQELADTFYTVEEKSKNRLSARVHPGISCQDAVGLMKAAGFKDIVVHSEDIRLVFPDLWSLCRFIKANGQSNALMDQNHFLCGKDLFDKFCSHYKDKFSVDSKVYATIEIVHLYGKA